MSTERKELSKRAREEDRISITLRSTQKMTIRTIPWPIWRRMIWETMSMLLKKLMKMRMKRWKKKVKEEEEVRRSLSKKIALFVALDHLTINLLNKKLKKEKKLKRKPKKRKSRDWPKKRKDRRKRKRERRKKRN